MTIIVDSAVAALKFLIETVQNEEESTGFRLEAAREIMKAVTVSESDLAIEEATGPKWEVVETKTGRAIATCAGAGDAAYITGQMNASIAGGASTFTYNVVKAG